MELPERMIHQSFRYVLGRQTYAVHDWCEWACENWDKIPGSEKMIIIRELEEMFEHDDARRASGWANVFPLGADVDRRAWERVRQKYYQSQLV